MNPVKTALITDLDNTLFDWVEVWHRCFSSMLEEIVRIGGIPAETLYPEISAVHQKHGTSEYSFLIEEIPSLYKVLDGRPATRVFEPAIRAYGEQRRKHLKLYNGVAETLLKIKGSGAQIIGYTESMAFYSNYRIRRLGLDGVLDVVFCPKDHILPKGIEDQRKYPAKHYELDHTVQRHTPQGSKKPDVDVLESIIEELDLTKERTVYIGDNLMKDIAMAQDCGVEDVWAAYGEAHERESYELLKKVTHWTTEDVIRESEIKSKGDIQATHAIANFSDLLKLFKFDDKY